MTNYAINKFTTDESDLATVVADLETQLETLDSTNDPVVYIDVVVLPNGFIQGVLITS